MKDLKQIMNMDIILNLHKSLFFERITKNTCFINNYNIFDNTLYIYLVLTQKTRHKSRR